jgi:hypothetical protein
LKQIPYEALPHEKVVLPDRQPRDGYEEPDHPYRRVPQVY